MKFKVGDMVKVKMSTIELDIVSGKVSRGQTVIVDGEITELIPPNNYIVLINGMNYAIEERFIKKAEIILYI